MNRELKFREWVKNPVTKIYEMKPIGRVSLAYVTEHDTFPDRIIIQYIGLKDKNGLEIYEGDIVAATKRSKGTIHIGTIGMPKSCWVLQLINDEGMLRQYRTSEFSELEIIGNKFENTEMHLPTQT